MHNIRRMWFFDNRDDLLRRISASYLRMIISASTPVQAGKEHL